MPSQLEHTFHLANALVLKSRKPSSSSSSGGASSSNARLNNDFAHPAKDFLRRELILVTGNVGMAAGVPNGLFVYDPFHGSKKSSSSSSPSSFPTAPTAVSFANDNSVVTFVLQTGDFSLVRSRCAPIPGTLPATRIPKHQGGHPMAAGWKMVDFIPLFCILNMESDAERSTRMSRVMRESGAWDTALRAYRDAYKPKMTIPQTPSARAVQTTTTTLLCTSSVREETPEEPSSKTVYPRSVQLGDRSVQAARFFISFQHPDDIKAQKPCVLSLVLFGQVPTADGGNGSSSASSAVPMASALDLLELEFRIICAVYGGTIRDPQQDSITSSYDLATLTFAVTVPKWRIVPFVSPPSGTGQSLVTWTTTILPLLYCGRMATHGIITERRGHAEDIVAASTPGSASDEKLVFTHHDILVAVGGDGVAHEVCNGLSIRNGYDKLPLQLHPMGTTTRTRSAEEPASTTHGEGHGLLPKDAADPNQTAAREHIQKVWASVPAPEPNGYYEADAKVVATTPYVALVASGSGCAVAKEVEVENFIISALAMLHLRPQTIDIYRLDPFDVPESVIKASDARYVKTSSDRKDVASRNQIEGSTSFAKAADTPVRFGLLAVMFACVNEVDKGSEDMRWMGNTRFVVKTVTMIVSGVPLYRVYFRHATDAFYQPEMVSASRNDHFARSFLKESTRDDGCTDWAVCPAPRVAFMSVNNIRMVARDINFAPYARPCDGFLDTLSVGPSEYDSSDPNYKLKVTRMDAIDFFGQAETGAHVKENSARYGKCRRAQVMPIDGNIMADGEVMNKTGLTISCVRNAITLLASPAMDWSN